MKVGILGNAVLDAAKLKAIADIPSREAVLSQLLGTILEPASMIARVIKNKFDPDGGNSPDEEQPTPAEEAAPAAEEAAPAAEAAAE
jgi:large subunit ribosomal protein L10